MVTCQLLLLFWKSAWKRVEINGLSFEIINGFLPRNQHYILHRHRHCILHQHLGKYRKKTYSSCHYFRKMVGNIIVFYFLFFYCRHFHFKIGIKEMLELNPTSPTIGRSTPFSIPHFLSLSIKNADANLGAWRKPRS